MNKLLLLGIVFACSPLAIAKSTNPSALELANKYQCRTEGCSLVCKAPNGDAYVRERKIDQARFVALSSGTVIYRLKKFAEDVEVVIPPGTETCQLQNIR